MSQGAGGAETWRLGTCAVDAPQCAGCGVQLRRHGRSAGAPLCGDATRANDASRRLQAQMWRRLRIGGACRIRPAAAAYFRADDSKANSADRRCPDRRLGIPAPAAVA